MLLYLTVGWCIRLGILPIVLRRNFAPGAAIAWIGIVFVHPYVGLALYLIFGESRLGAGRVVHHFELLKHYTPGDLSQELPAEITFGQRAMMRLGMRVGHMPVVTGNTIEFFTDSMAMVERLAADIEAATSHVHLLYYIFVEDATGQRIAAALKAAVQKGVKCRVMVDEFASRCDFRRNGFAAQLRASGVEVVAALPSSLSRRRDLRNHRKLAVIDDRLGYSGSQNLINPDYGGKRGGPWVDLSGRFTGPIVGEFATLFAMDWAFETNEQLDAPLPKGMTAVEGGVAMQVVPTGPASPAESFRRLFLGAVNTAQQRLVLTTPYFVPDEATILALLTAADRGVEISLIVPEKADSIMTAAAGRSHYSTLLDVGISIFMYQPGLIHAKIVTVDDSFGLFGSANLDVRSFHLNFELTTILYGTETTDRLRAVQQVYIENSRKLDAKEWANRGIIGRYADSAVALISPLL